MGVDGSVYCTRGVWPTVTIEPCNCSGNNFPSRGGSKWSQSDCVIFHIPTRVPIDYYYY